MPFWISPLYIFNLIFMWIQYKNIKIQIKKLNFLIWFWIFHTEFTWKLNSKYEKRHMTAPVAALMCRHYKLWNIFQRKKFSIFCFLIFVSMFHIFTFHMIVLVLKCYFVVWKKNFVNFSFSFLLLKTCKEKLNQ